MATNALVADSSITFLYNVRLNQEHRMHRFIASLNQINEFKYFTVSARVRGSFAEEVFPVIENKVYALYRNDTVKSWRLNLLQQVLDSQSGFFVLLQEDHAIASDNNLLIETLCEFAKLNLDFMPISFFPQYSKFEQLVLESGVSFTSAQNLRYLHINRNIAKKVSNKNHYLLNLIGIYKRDLLIKILISNRPFIKHFSGDSPFDVEQRPTQKWFLPINWALPNRELFACIDDDHGVQGYSLISRGLHASDAERVVDHHKIDEPGKIHSLIGNLNSARLLKFSRICRYTLMGLFDSFIRGKNQISPSRDGQPLPRSNGPE